MSYLSSDPEADADSLDDDELLQRYLVSSQATSDPLAMAVPDWPPSDSDPAVVLDRQITAWFKARHQDWRGEIELVLGAWIAAHAGTDRSIG